MDLKLKHIQHYPIGRDNALRVQDYKGTIMKVIGLSVMNQSVFVSTDSHQVDYPLRNVKPILRPMSDLYKEINGKIGLIELAKLQGDFQELISIDVKDDYYQDGQPAPYYAVEYISNVEENGDIHARLIFCPDTISFERFIMYNSLLMKPVSASDFQTCPIRYYNQIYEYLFTHHYNVFGLPEDMFIDINTIQD